jgi:hypothetical protein
MSVFDFPRIHFRGTQRVNPGTGNNNSLGPGQEMTVTSNTEAVKPVDTSLSDAAFLSWMEGADPIGLVRGQWNYYGDMSLRFDDVRVTSAVLGPGKFAVGDPIIGARVALLNALVCDVNPEGFDCTQIFSGAIEIDAPEAFGGTGVFLSRRPTRAVTRSLNWYRNVSFHGVLGNNTSGGAGGASATFIHSVAISKDDLEEFADLGSEYDEVLHHWWPKRNADGTPVSFAATAMHEVLSRKEVQGLQIRFNLYLCYPRIADSNLIEDFAAGRKTENPAIGQVLGTIAPWRVGEPASLTIGRTLNPAAPYVNSYRSDGKAYYLGPGVARVQNRSSLISVDLINTLPEDGPEGRKFPLGVVTLGMRKATPPGVGPATNTEAIATVGEIANDQGTFEGCGGVYDFELADEGVLAKLSGNEFELVINTERYGVLLYEPEYMVGSDCEAAYLDQAPPGSPDLVVRVPPETRELLPLPLRGYVPIHVRQRGQVPDQTVLLTIEQWKFTPSGDPQQWGLYIFPRKLGLEKLEIRDGCGSHELFPLDGTGVFMFRYVAPGQWPQSIDGGELAKTAFRENYTFLRVLPHDAAASAVPDEQLTYESIYEHVFRYYALILPAMTKRLDMSRSSRDLWASPSAARYLLRSTEVELWEHWAYMPRTRDLSATRRHLLRRFCRKVLSEHGLSTTVKRAT